MSEVRRRWRRRNMVPTCNGRRKWTNALLAVGIRRVREHTDLHIGLEWDFSGNICVFCTGWKPSFLIFPQIILPSVNHTHFNFSTWFLSNMCVRCLYEWSCDSRGSSSHGNRKNSPLPSSIIRSRGYSSSIRIQRETITTHQAQPSQRCDFSFDSDFFWGPTVINHSP